MLFWTILLAIASATPVSAVPQNAGHSTSQPKALPAHSGLIDDMCRVSVYREPTNLGLHSCVADQISALAEIYRLDQGGSHQIESRCVGYVTGERGLGSMEYVDANLTLACVRKPDRDMVFADCVVQVTRRIYDGMTIFWDSQAAEGIEACFNGAIASLRPKQVRYFDWEDGTIFADASTTAHAITGPIAVRKNRLALSGRQIAIAYIRELQPTWQLDQGYPTEGAVYELARDPGPLRNGNRLCSKDVPAKYIAVYRTSGDSKRDLRFAVWDATALLSDLGDKGLCGTFWAAKP